MYFVTGAVINLIGYCLASWKIRKFVWIFNIFLSISYDLKCVTCKCEMKIYCKNKLNNDLALMIDKNNIDVELFFNIQMYSKDWFSDKYIFQGFFKFSKDIYFWFFIMKKRTLNDEMCWWKEINIYVGGLKR